MKPARALLILLAAIATSAWAELRVIDRENNKTTYVDLSTIRTDGNIRRVWKILNLNAQGEFGELSMKVLGEYDCGVERMRITSMIWYSGPMGTGKVISSDNRQDYQQWVNLPPGSKGDIERMLFCGQPF